MVSRLPSQKAIPVTREGRTTSKRSGRAACRWALAAALLTLIPATGPAAGLEWALVDSSCAIPPGVAVVSCGTLGTYLFADPLPILACNPDDGGVAPDEFYVQPRGIKLSPATPVTISSGLVGTGLRLKTELPPEPLARAVIIDWNDAHGAAVKSVLEQVASGAAYADLYALDAPELVAALGSSISDAHLIANLCSLVEEVAAGGVQPAVVNLSFGRYSGEDIDPATCSGTLPCQIARIFARLVSIGTTVTAAAGNHQDLLFPARLPGVLAVGTLDVAYFAAHHEAVPSWESPVEVAILLPGDGVCANGELPAGSSFAAPAAAGYIAARSRDGVTFTEGVWKLEPGPECYVMTSAAGSIPGCVSGLDSFIAQTLSGLPCPVPEAAATPGAGTAPAGQTSTPPPPPVIKVVRLSSTSSPMPGFPGYPEWQADSLHPTPGGDPCVPCMDPGGGGGSALRAKIAVLPLPGADIALDLSSSAGLESSFHILKVYLRAADRFYQALMDNETAAELTVGAIDQLVLKNALSFVLDDEQPSIFLVEWVDLDGNGLIDAGERFWTSSPVYLP